MLICLLIKIGLTPSGSISSKYSVTISVLYIERMRRLKGKKCLFKSPLKNIRCFSNYKFVYYIDVAHSALVTRFHLGIYSR